MYSLIIPKIGEVWKEKNSDNKIRILYIFNEYNMCEFKKMESNTKRAISISTLNEFYTPPLNAKLDILLGEDFEN